MGRTVRATAPITPDLIITGMTVRILLGFLKRKKRRKAMDRIAEGLAELVRSDRTVTLIKVVGEGDGADEDLIVSRAQALVHWRAIRGAVEEDVLGR